MIDLELDEKNGIAIVRPGGAISKEDITALAARIDPYIERHGKLNGIVISADRFPGWQDFGALISHFRFVNDHHRHVARVAAVGDSSFLSIMPRVVGHFVKAEVRHFDAGRLDEALAWIASPEE